MTRSFRLLAGAAVIALALSGPAFAQGTAKTAAATPEAGLTPQTVTSPVATLGLPAVKIDLASVATGYRVSKVVGATVVNEANETVGTVDDLIITPNDKVPFAVLSVGSFLGIGGKLVIVPYSSLEVKGNQVLLRGATKESLSSHPEFKYAS